MRGKDGGRCVYHGNHGITPAYAGKSYWHGCRNSSRWDHPRLCGEKAWQSVRVQCRQGSPPPMRGKVKQDGSTLCRCRITPAYAGKRLRRQAPRCQSEDHPRLCGEKRMYTLLDLLPWGSPPPMRGKDHAGKHVALDIGITPAYAGKRHDISTIFAACRDHPRLCGEKRQNQFQVHTG